MALSNKRNSTYNYFSHNLSNTRDTAWATASPTSVLTQSPRVKVLAMTPLPQVRDYQYFTSRAGVLLARQLLSDPTSEPHPSSLLPYDHSTPGTSGLWLAPQKQSLRQGFQDILFIEECLEE